MSAIIVAAVIVLVGALLARPTYRAAWRQVAEAERIRKDAEGHLDRAMEIHRDAARMLDEARAINENVIRLAADAQRLLGRPDASR